MKTTRDREYLYTIDKRVKTTDANGITKWQQIEVKATSLTEVSRLTGVALDDLRYVTKNILK